jgi:hypothetical protein
VVFTADPTAPAAATTRAAVARRPALMTASRKGSAPIQHTNQVHRLRLHAKSAPSRSTSKP